MVGTRILRAAWSTLRDGARFLAVAALVAAAGRAQTTTLASQSSAGVQGNLPSWAPAVSADGRFVAFRSGANNLVPVDANGLVDVFVHDRQSGATEFASVSSAGAQGDGSSLDPTLSADGRFCAFFTHATNFLAVDANGAVADVFVRDRLLGVTELVSQSSSGVQGHGQSYTGSITPDGRLVVFYSNADNFAAPDTNGALDVYLRDRLNGTTELVSVNTAGVVSDDNCYGPVLSADGRFVAFMSPATNLAPGDDNFMDDVFVRDRLLGTTALVSVSSAGVLADFGGSFPSISADGRLVAFESAATNLAPNDNGHYDIYLRDLVAGTTVPVSVDSGGVLGNSASRYPSLSADGRTVGFTSYADNLVPGDANLQYDVFVRDLATGANEIASVSTAGVQGDGKSQLSALSADGRIVAFESVATNLVPGDGNAAEDAFVRERAAPATPEVYCLSKTNALGCTPAIGSTGVPSASAGSGFLVSAANVRNNKSGVLFYGTSGSTFLSFQGGYLCVRPPLKRTLVQGSGGNPPPDDCSGAYALDFNSTIAGGLDPALVPGAEVWAQYWSRDPGFAPPQNTGLTDALAFVIGP